MAVFRKIVLYIFLVVIVIIGSGYILGALMKYGVDAFTAQDYSLLFNSDLFFDPTTYMLGVVCVLGFGIYYFVFSKQSSKHMKKLMRSKAKGVESSLENARFMTEKERDEYFAPYDYSELKNIKKDGVPVYAYMPGGNKKASSKLKVNIASPMHALVIGATGSGKTTTFINPMVQVLGETSAGSSMILTDPKGELFQLHSKKLQDRGYNVMVLDLRDPYSSYRWNPLESVFLMYQEYLAKGQGIFKRHDDVEGSGLQLKDPVEAYTDPWYEYQGLAYSSSRSLLSEIKMARQRLYDELYEDLNDLVGVLCPIESKDDPVWEKGARSIIMATLLAMLEDSGDPKLGMTIDKFNFYNVNKAIANSENNFAELKDYFKGRSHLSKSVTLSRQVMSAADNTLSSYMSIAFDKMSMFNDEGICALTSATDIDASVFADKPTALFLKIPDEKDTRHGLAAVFILCIYKALIKKASAREDLSLPRNVYFILDEFGNMPQIDKFDKMITVGRSRKIWFSMVVQSYVQLNNVYGDKVADIVKSNCGIKMFIGSNDIETCKEFSELCGNMTVETSSVSSSSNASGEFNVSTQLQTRPLIYPSELQKLNNKQSTGNAIIVTFGNNPLKAKYTPSYLCPLYQFGAMDLTDIRYNVFFGDEIFYNLAERNSMILEGDGANAQ